MFDPENVDRYTCPSVYVPFGTYTKSSDYDSLLALYRGLKAKRFDVNRTWPEFKKDLQSSGKSNTEAS